MTDHGEGGGRSTTSRGLDAVSGAAILEAVYNLRAEMDRRFTEQRDERRDHDARIDKYLDSLATKSEVRRLCEDVSDIRDDIKELRGQTVSQDAFRPVRLLVYGFASVILSGVAVALIALVLK